MFSWPRPGVLPIPTISRTVTEPLNPVCMCNVLFISDSLSGEVSRLRKRGGEPCKVHTERILFRGEKIFLALFLQHQSQRAGFFFNNFPILSQSVESACKMFELRKAFKSCFCF